MNVKKMEPRSLYEFVTAEGEDRMRAAIVECGEKRQEVARIAAVAANVRTDLERAPRARMALQAAAADATVARLLGEPTPEVPPLTDTEPINTSALSDALEGLQRRKQEAQQALRAAEGNFRNVVIEEAIVEPAKRAAEEYVALVEKLAQLWVTIDSASSLAQEVRGADRPFVSISLWGRMQVIGTDSNELPALRAASNETMYGPVLFNAMDARECGLPLKAIERLKADVERRVGNWPLDKRR